MDWPGKPVLLPGVPAATYHADQLGDVPTLSRSEAWKLLFGGAPAHLFEEHPRLKGSGDRRPTKAMGEGQVAHALLLGSGLEQIEVHDVPDWRGRRADLRDDALARGLTPIKTEDYDRISRACGELALRLRELGIDLPCLPGWDRAHKTEMTALWEHSLVPFAAKPAELVRCRGRLDHAVEITGGAVINDLKIVPEGTLDERSDFAFRRDLNYNADGMQPAWYLAAVAAVRPELEGRTAFNFIRCELTPPYCIDVVPAAETLISLGQSRMERACRAWAELLARGDWPAVRVQPAAEASEWALVEESTRGGL